MRCFSVCAWGCSFTRRGACRLRGQIPHAHRTQLRLDREGAPRHRLQLPQVRAIRLRKIDADQHGPQAFGNDNEEEVTRLPETIIENAPLTTEIRYQSRICSWKTPSDRGRSK